LLLVFVAFLVPTLSLTAAPVGLSGESDAALDKLGVRRGLCVVVGLPETDQPRFVTDLAAGSPLVVYFQSRDDAEVRAVREEAEKTGLLGWRVFADQGDDERIQLADNTATAILVSPSTSVEEKELLRVLHPEGRAVLADREIVKPFPQGTDHWSHPRHGPDNNKVSCDQLARAPYLTQFVAKPMLAPYPTLTVAAGGRLFKIFGHEPRRDQAAGLTNTLIALNGYNGMFLWKRELTRGFLIHRNTLIATPDVLYLGDDRSCKMLDARTGQLRGEISPPVNIAGGTVWKWMALEDGILYALLGGGELRGYRDPKTAQGFGSTFFAIDPETNKILWHHREEEYVDSRGVAMKNGRIYYYHPNRFLACLDATDGNVLWRNTRAAELEAIRHFPNVQSQAKTWTGYGFWSVPWIYMTCDEQAIYLCSENVQGLYAFSTDDGRLLWKKDDTGEIAHDRREMLRAHGQVMVLWENYRVLLRDQKLYAWAARGSAATWAARLDPRTGEALEEIPRIGGCVQPTASVDSVFSRAMSLAREPSGTRRWDLDTGRSHFITAMRPACTDGVIVSDGLLYWTPWNCICAHDLFGVISLGPAGDFDFHATADEARQLVVSSDDIRNVAELKVKPGDWASSRGDRPPTDSSRFSVPEKVAPKWTFMRRSARNVTTSVQESPFFHELKTMPTAPTAAGDMVFFGASDGTVHALDAAGGRPLWKAYTGGEIHFPPVIWNGRAYVGSNDGRVYAFEAKTGRLLWRFRLAPCERKTMVYERLASTWPVAGGVVVEDGVLYAAAGMAQYDGVHLYALDAVTGTIKWHNSSPGEEIGLSGHLHVASGRLSFYGGHMSMSPQFDLKTGQRLPGRSPVAPRGIFKSRGMKILFPREAWERGWLPSKWNNEPLDQIKAIAYTRDVALVAGRQRGSARAALVAIQTQDGTPLWEHSLPSTPVMHGIALDHKGQVFVSLEDGQVMCFSERE